MRFGSAVEGEEKAERVVSLGWAYFVVGYVAAVLLIDTARATQFGHLDRYVPWVFSATAWQPRGLGEMLKHSPLPGWLYGWLASPFLASFDGFKFVFWFVVPVLLCGRRIDLKAFGTARWQRFDWYLALAAGVVGFGVVCCVPIIPGVREYYASAGTGMSFGAKLWQAGASLVWTLSWLTGWEFMHRYFLLRPVALKWPRAGWLLPPFFEWAYHLQKPWLEGLGMLVFSLLATQYVLRRRNVALPFFVHLFIEIALPLTLLFGALNPIVWAMGPR